jgi:hypothetical protein
LPASAFAICSAPVPHLQQRPPDLPPSRRKRECFEHPPICSPDGTIQDKELRSLKQLIEDKNFHAEPHVGVP